MTSLSLLRDSGKPLYCMNTAHKSCKSTEASGNKLFILTLNVPVGTFFEKLQEMDKI